MNDLKISESIDRYQKAHFSDENGYQPYNHNFLRDDVILQMYEYIQIFRKSFSKIGWNNKEIPAKKVLEVGSAWGLRLNQLLGFNFNPVNLTGIDIQEEYIIHAKRLNPLISFELMSATEIKYPDKYFDFSFASVALQAMVDEAIIAKSLSEMCRVTKEFVLIIDVFDPKYSCQRNGAIYLKGVDFQQINNLKYAENVEQVNLIGSFWTISNTSWRFYRLLNKIGFSSISYSVAIGLLAKHSHKAYLVKLRDVAVTNCK